MSEQVQDQTNPNLERINIQLDWIVKLYNKTIAYAKTDPEVSLILARKVAESICNQIFYAKFTSSNSTKSMMLKDVTDKLKETNVLPKKIVAHLNTIHQFGNYGVHYQGEEEIDDSLTFDDITPSLSSLTSFVNWYFNEHHTTGRKFRMNEVHGLEINQPEIDVKPLPKLAAMRQDKKSAKLNPAANFSHEGELTLSDDFTGKRPIAIILGDGIQTVVRSWKDVLVETCRLLIQLDENKFKNLENINGMKSYISSKSLGMRKPISILDSMFIETNLSANAIRDLIKRMFVAYDRNNKEYKVYFEAH
jgi:hypothetical protein